VRLGLFGATGGTGAESRQGDVRVGVLSDAPGPGVYRAEDDGSIRGTGTISRADVARFVLSELQAGLWVRRRPVLVY